VKNLPTVASKNPIESVMTVEQGRVFIDARIWMSAFEAKPEHALCRC
jgi:hypothetical protein